MTDNAGAPTPPQEPTAPEAPSLEQVEELLRADEASEGEPEPSPEPEPAPEPVQEDPDLPRGDLRVALREERERRRQSEAQLQNVTNYQQQLAAQMAQLRQFIAPQQPQQPAVPDFDSDPATHLKYQVETLKGAVQQMHQQEVARQQRMQAEAAMAQAENVVNTTEAEFAEKNKDYYEAVDFMRNRIKARFETLGVPKAQLDAAVAQDLRTFAIKALQAGANPAEKVFQLAKIEGYNGSAGSNSAKLSTIAKGVQATRGARSSAPASSGEMTMEQAVNLSYKQLAKMGDDEFRRLAGG